MFDTFAEVQATFNTARSKAAGKPLNVHLRLYSHPEGIVAYYHRFPLCIYRPDDTIEFIMDPDIVAARAQSLHSQLCRVCRRIGLRRIDTGYYALQGRYYRADYFAGIRFTLTGECINPRPRLIDTINKEQNRVWRRKLRWFKRELILREKLGVLRTLADDPTPLQRPHIAVSELIFRMMNKEHMDHEELRTLARTFHYYRTDSLAALIYYQCTHTYNIELRKRFHVFDEV